MALGTLNDVFEDDAKKLLSETRGEEGAAHELLTTIATGWRAVV